jgi:Domain of unknown function (DUF4919)
MKSSPRPTAAPVLAGLGLACLLLAGTAHAQATAATGDAYAHLVAQAEAANPATDFRALRFAWLDSAERRTAPDPAAAQKALHDAASRTDNAAVRDAAQRVIAAHYTDLEAHMMRRLACVALKDDACATHEHFVEFGLLKSILDSGDGKAAATAWHVASIDEEYFVMQIAQVSLKQQALVMQNGRAFDHLTVTTADGTDKAMWFDITDFFSNALG